MEFYRERFVNYLDEGDPVTIAGFTWPNSEVFKTMAENDYEAHFVDWVADRKNDSLERACAFLEEYEVLPRFKLLQERHRNGQVIPFVGAGMSVPSGYRLWGDFILSLMADLPNRRADVEELLEAGRYEEAAQYVHDALTADNFAEECHNQLGEHLKTTRGAVCLFPDIFPNEVVTTNFDYVLNHVYEGSDAPFDKEFVGARLGQAGQQLGNHPHSLIRLHGEGETATNRVLTTQEYQALYGNGGNFHHALERIIGARSFLFMGCSLMTDRTLEALCRIKQAAGADATRHYAFLPYPGDDAREARRAFLGQAEIHPIYYPPDDHDPYIEDLLICLMEGPFE